MTTCVSCGCDDLHACVAAGGQPCHWLVEFDDGTGVCSECTEAFEKFEAGEADWAELPNEARPSSELILPGDEEFDRTVCGLRRRLP